MTYKSLTAVTFTIILLSSITLSSATAGEEGVYRLPAAWGEAQGNPIEADGKPLWRAERLWPEDPAEIAHYKPMKLMGSAWSDDKHAHAGQPNLKVKNGAVELGARGPWKGNAGSKIPVLTFTAPQDGLYQGQGMAEAVNWGGGKRVILQIVKRSPLSGTVKPIAEYTIENKQKQDLAEVSAALKAGEELSFIAKMAGFHRAGSIHLKGFGLKRSGDIPAGGEDETAAAKTLIPDDLPTGENARYIPRDAGIIDVKAKYGAKGDGTTDDTAAIRMAVLENMGRNRILFFPAGTYILSDSIDWKKNGTWGAMMTVQGEGVGHTIIRLRDECPGFNDPEKTKPIFRPGSIASKRKEGGGNRAHANNFFDLTLSVGKGNPGAIGLDYCGSNIGAVRNVEIRSEDGAGAVGLALVRETGPALIKNVSIDGFAVGIKTAGWLYGTTLEYITLTNQTKAGLVNDGHMVALRRFKCTGAPTAIQSKDGLIVLDDAKLGTDAPVGPAITVEGKGAAVIRDVSLEGFTEAIKHGDTVLPGPSVEEFCTHKAHSLFPASDKTLNLPVEETPWYDNANPADWANVEHYGAKHDGFGDDSEGVQKAIDSGKPVVYLPRGSYKFREPVIVRGAVRAIIGFSASFKDNPDNEIYFHFENKQPVVMRQISGPRGAGRVIIKTDAPVIFAHVSSLGIDMENESATVFLEDVIGGGGPLVIKPGQRVYARQLNNEMALKSKETSGMVQNLGGLFWVLGYKTEFGSTVLRTTNGGRSEILGGLWYPAQGVHDKSVAAIEVEDAAMSASFTDIAFSSRAAYKVVVRETQNDSTKTLSRGTIPIKWGAGHYAVPLFVSGTGE